MRSEEEEWSEMTCRFLAKEFIAINLECKSGEDHTFGNGLLGLDRLIKQPNRDEKGVGYLQV